MHNTVSRANREENIMNETSQVIFVPVMGRPPGDFANVLTKYQEFYAWMLRHGAKADKAGEKLVRVDIAELHRATSPIIEALEQLARSQGYGAANHGQVQATEADTNAANNVCPPVLAA